LRGLLSLFVSGAFIVSYLTSTGVIATTPQKGGFTVLTFTSADYATTTSLKFTPKFSTDQLQYLIVAGKVITYVHSGHMYGRIRE
jgi:hypothetical protein